MIELLMSEKFNSKLVNYSKDLCKIARKYSEEEISSEEFISKGKIIQHIFIIYIESEILKLKDEWQKETFKVGWMIRSNLDNHCGEFKELMLVKYKEWKKETK